LFVVATRGSVLYFVIVEMSVVNIMYQTSLRQFLQVFDLSMTRSTKSPVTAKRIHNIIDHLTFSTFSYTARGLYEKDKFLFTILMTLKIQLQAKVVGPEEFQCFIKGAQMACFVSLFLFSSAIQRVSSTKSQPAHHCTVEDHGSSKRGANVSKVRISVIKLRSITCLVCAEWTGYNLYFCFNVNRLTYDEDVHQE